MFKVGLITADGGRRKKEIIFKGYLKVLDGYILHPGSSNTVIPRLTSDPANEFFG